MMNVGMMIRNGGEGGKLPPLLRLLITQKWHKKNECLTENACNCSDK